MANNQQINELDNNFVALINAQPYMSYTPFSAIIFGLVHQGRFGEVRKNMYK